ncbi:hypothetical protein ETAA8_05100 [Anatilimnocola aggregata]|uniref:DUF1549 domain-containing protein n=1 Tax=Anatilimnocola aggregata TaxID=2528021 RepID=A0A517Y5N5_9BACT|nr:DUF1549 and DUF1553 domain-containing protein [Anatilimnocola aggregata]QDU25442.1 hypothetical protein ETAA8_05100 [Anatilimnocola aggregata]
MSRIVGGLLLVALMGGVVFQVNAQTPKAGATSTAADYNIPQVKYINEQIRQVWTDNGMVPSPPATEGEWCRRVYLDVIGRVPSVTELKEFQADKTPERKLKLVNKLLNDEIYLEDYARNWTTIWTNILIGRTGGTEQRTLTSREGMQKYLRDSFAQDKPYDRMVYELVSATGTTSPGGKGFNGAANYLVMKLEEKAAQATAMTAKNFLGLQVQCTQCHNHPFNDWKQQKFWEFNAFFQQTRALRTFIPGTRDVQSAELVNQDFAGEGGGGDASEAIIFYELRNGLMASAYPVFVDGKEAPRSGYVSDVNRREVLAKMIVASDYMDKMIANRIWHHFLGYGFTKPIDDMGPHNTPTHPELLDYLGKEVRKNSFNLKELIKWVALSEAYSLSSKITPSNKADDPLMGETPKFTHFYLRNMRAEELYESLIVATEAQKTKGDYAEQEKLKTQWLSQFNQTFGTDEGDEQTTFNGTIPQQLMMMNGDLVKKAVSTEQGSFLQKVATSKLSPAQKIDYLFQSALSRAPTQSEVDIANKLLTARGGDSVAALQDVFWAALNANEFILQH